MACIVSGKVGSIRRLSILLPPRPGGSDRRGYVPPGAGAAWSRARSVHDRPRDVVFHPRRVYARRADGACLASDVTLVLRREPSSLGKTSHRAASETLRRGREAFGLPRATSGLPRDASGLPCEAFGLARDASGLPCEAFGLAHDASGSPCEAFGLARNASGSPCEAFGLATHLVRPVRRLAWRATHWVCHVRRLACRAARADGGTRRTEPGMTHAEEETSHRGNQA